MQNRDPQKRAADPETPSADLVELALFHPDEIEKNPMVDLISLENPELYLKICHNCTIGWRNRFRHLKAHQRETLALISLENTSDFWISWIERIGDFAPESGGPKIVRRFLAGVQHRREFVDGTLSPSRWASMLYAGNNATRSMHLPYLQTDLLYNAAISYPMKKEQRQHWLAWQVEEVKRYLALNESGEGR